MREGWDYKALGEVSRIINGKNQKAVEDPNGQYPICGSGGIMGYATDYLCPENTVIIGRKGNINKPIFMKEKFWNVDTAFGISSNKSLLHSKFLYYFCVDFNFEKLNKAVTIPSLVKSDLLKISIPIPPLQTQQSIVDELDKINDLIKLKKAQLSDLDNLAQSIFYEMFGDPVENEKGWEVRKLGEVCENRDFMRKPITAKDRIPGNIPYYGASGIVDYVQDFIFNGEYLLVSEDGANLLARSTPIAFGIKGRTWVNNHAHVLKFHKGFSQLYVEFSINLRDISSMVYGCAQPKLTQSNLNKMPIPYPPLSLQQTFSKKIEAIEEQKKLINSTIKDLETLLASRMQYWFE